MGRDSMAWLRDVVCEARLRATESMDMIEDFEDGGTLGAVFAEHGSCA